LTQAFFPLTCPELGKDFDLARSLRFGHLPSVFQEADPKAYLESYVRTYLEEEVRDEGITRNLSAFARFLEAASFSQGAVLNVSSVARECAVERKVVENYFSILEDLLIAYRIPVFTKKTKRRLVNHDKFYFFDAGVFRSLRPSGPLDMPEEIDGAALETLVLQELVAVNDLSGLGYKVYYWRTSNGTEVDFVLYGPRGMVAIEVKRSGRIDSSMTKGLRSFMADYPMAKGLLFYGGDRVMNLDGIEVVPLARALPGLMDILK
jgi:predicted AAA+ superfamily ATPase